MTDAFNTYKKWARDQKFPHQCAPTPALVKKAEEELTLIQYFPLWAVIVIMVVVRTRAQHRPVAIRLVLRLWGDPDCWTVTVYTGLDSVGLIN